MTAVPRPSLLSLDDALAQLLAGVQPLNRLETVSTFDADGRVLAEDVVSELQVPAFDNSSMDGYAVRCVDVPEAGAVLQVTQRIPAGADLSQAKPLGALSAARIFTGAPIPQGADAVVMQEDCELVNEANSDVTLRSEGSIRINTMPAKAQWIRRAGEDVRQGAVVLARGALLSPAELGLAASVGRERLTVAAKPRVALFSTGDELVMPGEVAPAAMRAGSIYNSNRFFLRAMLIRMGCEVTDFGIVPDNRGATLKALSDAASQHDLIVTSGGVSVGEEDHIKPAVQQLGALNLWQIAMKPGKPFAFGHVNKWGNKWGTDPNKWGTDPEFSARKLGSVPHLLAPHLFTYFVGLPGNPVSSFVTFLLLVRPLLRKLQGSPDKAWQPMALRADFDVPRADKRREFLRVRRNADGGLDLFPNQSSGVLTSAVWGDGLVDNPAGQTIKRGDVVSYLSFAELLQ
ncbi:MAG: molybdopterin molybdotransferase MoeA [Cytophagales bacterium]|nr:molybdopterin molybdotransferase MoeA [Cytophagales bacterium]